MLSSHIDYIHSLKYSFPLDFRGKLYDYLYSIIKDKTNKSVSFNTDINDKSSFLDFSFSNDVFWFDDFIKGTGLASSDKGWLQLIFTSCYLDDYQNYLNIAYLLPKEIKPLFFAIEVNRLALLAGNNIPLTKGNDTPSFNVKLYIKYLINNYASLNTELLAVIYSCLHRTNLLEGKEAKLSSIFASFGKKFEPVYEISNVFDSLSLTESLIKEKAMIQYCTNAINY